MNSQSKTEKKIILQDLQDRTVKIKELHPARYSVKYPSLTYLKPVFLIDGRPVKIGKFFSSILNDDSASITI